MDAPKRRIAALFGAGLALLALAFVRGSGGGPALYDGLCTPPSYVLLGSSPGPESASETYSVNDLAGTQELATPESPPQAQVIVAAGSLAAAPGATTVTISITPVTPPATPPGDAIDGNVYDFEATSGGRVVAAASGHPVTIGLESTTSGRTLTLEQYVGGSWSVLRAIQNGCATIYDAAAPSLGRFALVAHGASTGAPGAGSGESALAVVLIVVAVLASIIGGVRVSRRHG